MWIGSSPMLYTKLAAYYRQDNFGVVVCDWIDQWHLPAGGDMPFIVDAQAGKMFPLTAHGDCGGHIPGGL